MSWFQSVEVSAVEPRRGCILLPGNAGLWQLSGGEKLRTAIARALINRPKLILADEPTGSLDPASTGTVAVLLLALNRDHGVTLIVVTHNIALAQRMGKTFELRNGKLH